MSLVSNLSGADRTEKIWAPKLWLELAKYRSLLVAPAIVFMLAFYVVPVAKLIAASFRASDADAGLSLSAYVSVLGSQRFLSSLERTLGISVIATGLTFLIALPIALFLIGAGRRTRTFVLIVTFVSLSASLIVRNYGWLVVLADSGPINRLLLTLGIVSSPVRMAYSEGATMVALVHYALPFMILPIYGSLVRVKPSLWEAAQALGGSPARTLWSVVLPLTMPGIYGGVCLTFAIATSLFVTPMMLGSPATAFVSQLAADEFLVQLNFARGAAIVVVLTFSTFAVLAAYTLAVRRIGRTHV